VYAVVVEVVAPSRSSTQEERDRRLFIPSKMIKTLPRPVSRTDQHVQTHLAYEVCFPPNWQVLQLQHFIPSPTLLTFTSHSFFPYWPSIPAVVLSHEEPRHFP
jgi:hypothetical protein